MNKAIITPTYKNHFKYIISYLESYKRYVEDSLPIYFTISKSEDKLFRYYIKPYEDIIDIRVIYIDNLLKEQNINLTPEEYLDKFGRYTFQTAKKLYSALHIKERYSLILDCESMWVKKTNMEKLFDEYFADPFVVITKIENCLRMSENFNTMLNNIDKLLGGGGINTMWYIENFMWYYDKNILQDLFNKYGNLDFMALKLLEENKNTAFEKIIKTGIFEIVLYFAYLYKHVKDYPDYRIVCADDYLSKNLSDKQLKKYKQTFFDKFHGGAGLIEHSAMLLTDENVIPLAGTFKELGLNIIRVEQSTPDNVKLQEKFIKMVSPNILAASQNHVFGVNDKNTTLIKQTKYYLKYKKHLKKLAECKKQNKLLKVIQEIFSVMRYKTLLLIHVFKNLSIYL